MCLISRAAEDVIVEWHAKPLRKTSEARHCRGSICFDAVAGDTAVLALCCLCPRVAPPESVTVPETWPVALSTQMLDGATNKVDHKMATMRLTIMFLQDVTLHGPDRRQAYMVNND